METDLRQSDGWAEYLRSQGWLMEKLGKTKVYIRKIPLLGSVIKIQRPAKVPPTREIDRLAKKHHALFVKLELATEIRQPPPGFELDQTPNLPTRTILIDLTQSEEELWKDLSKDARQSIRRAHDYQLSVDRYQFGDRNFETALGNFHQLLKETGRRQKFWTPEFAQLKKKAELFGQDATLFLVFDRSQIPVAGALVLGSDGTHSASSPEGKQLYAPYLLLWETIRYLKKTGKFPHHDLAGVYDPRFHRATKRWQGFTTFKQKFGGKEVVYPRPLIKYYSPIIRLLFHLAIQ